MTKIQKAWFQGFGLGILVGGALKTISTHFGW